MQSLAVHQAREATTSTLSNAALIPEARPLTSRYDFISELGRGGMGIVYLACARASGKQVAIKLLDAASADSAEAAIRFAREARTGAALDHPNIVRTLGIERLERGAVAIVNEYVEGQTLRGMLRASGPLPFDRAAETLRGVAAALAHAHERRIVHRDVKPENIFIEASSGRALLSDFGIARPLDADTQLTIAGASFGTPSYMAPEQVKGAALDERADVYSLGLVGWEMLTGARPWEGETLYDVLHKQQHEPLPSLAALRPDIPSYLLVAIEGALAKGPEDRWADGAAFLERLTPVPAMLPPRRVPGAKAWNASVVDMRGADRQGAQEQARAAAERDDEPTMRIDARRGAGLAPGDAPRDTPRDTPLHAPPAANREPAFASPPESEPEPDRRERELEIRVERLAASPDETREPAAPGPAKAQRRRTMPRLAGPLLVAALASAGALVVLTGTDLRRSVDSITSAFPWARPDSAQTATRNADAPSANAPVANAPATEAPRTRDDSSTRDGVAVRDSSNARIAERARATPSTAPRTPPATNSPASAPARSSTPPVAPPAARPPVARPPAPKAPSPSPAPTAASRAAPSTDARCSSTAYSAQRSCLLAAIDRNDSDLNRIYQENIARLRREAGGAKEPPSVERLRVEQRAWIVQRDRACRQLRGPLWGAIRIPCYAAKSDEREAVLKRRLQGSARD